MKLITTFLVVVFCSFPLFAQTDFEKGYYIDNSGNRVDCLIKNIDWRDNPSSFEYRVEGNRQSKTATSENVQEFGISDYLKFERHQVDIDLTSNLTSGLKGGKTPSYTNLKVFLKKLIEGEANLFLYENGAVKRFFYEVGNDGVTPLIFKRFKEEGGKIGSNTWFRQQLLTSMKCVENAERSVSRLDYKESHLLPFFVDYNSCSKNAFKVYRKPKRKNFFSITARIGLNHNAFTVGNGSPFQSRGINGDYGSDISLRYGFEFEFVLPINNGKWGLFVEPSYNNHTGNKEDDATIRELRYTTLEVPIGVRHYFFLSEKSSLFFNGSFAFVFNGDSEIRTYRKDNGVFLAGLEVNGTEEYLSFGLGYSYNKKIGFEFRANTSRDLLGNNVSYNSKYNQSYSLILGYRFL